MIGLMIMAAALGAPDAYQTQKETLAAERLRLARALAASTTQEERTQALKETKTVLIAHIRHGLLEAWLGTPWDFYGTSEVPGEGTIACGYLVSTVLRDAGFRVQRYKLAQQASEYIVKTLAEPSEIQRFSDASASKVVDAVESQGDGIYIAGFDYHVGFLIVEGGTAEFCHSSYVGASEVMCTVPEEDPAFDSRYRVVGPIGQRTLRRWLKGQAIPTQRPR